MKPNISIIILISYFLILTSSYPSLVLAGPQSTNYEILDYGFGSGGSEGLDSSSYSLFGTLGETDTATPLNSTNYSTLPGLAYTMQANVTAAPSFTNPANYYNKLHIVLNTGNNPSDAEFAIAISPNAFASTTQFVQSDTTIGAEMVWQNIATWGAGGFDIIGLQPGTTYTVKVASRHGKFTQSQWSETIAAATITPTMTFSLSPTAIENWSLTPGTIGTAPSTATVSVTTNGYNGATIYISDSKSGLQSISADHTISSVDELNNDLTALGEGYGARSTTVSQTSGGPMQAVSPYNGSESIVGKLDSTKRIIFNSSGAPVNGGQASFELKAKPAVTAPPGSDYSDTITVIGSAAF